MKATKLQLCVDCSRRKHLMEFCGRERICLTCEAARQRNNAEVTAFRKIIKKDQDARRYESERELVLERNKSWREDNKETYRASLKKTYKAIKSDPLRAFVHQIRGSVRGAFMRGRGWRKDSSTQDILGCTFEEAMEILSKRYEEMYGRPLVSMEGKHLDHIIPMVNAESKAEAIHLNSIHNLQILEEEDNLRKSDKLVYWIEGEMHRVDLSPLEIFREKQERRQRMRLRAERRQGEWVEAT